MYADSHTHTDTSVDEHVICLYKQHRVQVVAIIVAVVVELELEVVGMFAVLFRSIRSINCTVVCILHVSCTNVRSQCSCRADWMNECSPLQ